MREENSAEPDRRTGSVPNQSILLADLHLTYWFCSKSNLNSPSLSSTEDQSALSRAVFQIRHKSTDRFCSKSTPNRFSFRLQMAARHSVGLCFKSNETTLALQTGSVPNQPLIHFPLSPTEGGSPLDHWTAQPGSVPNHPGTNILLKADTASLFTSSCSSLP